MYIYVVNDGCIHTKDNVRYRKSLPFHFMTQMLLWASMTVVELTYVHALSASHLHTPFDL